MEGLLPTGPILSSFLYFYAIGKVIKSELQNIAYVAGFYTTTVLDKQKGLASIQINCLCSITNSSCDFFFSWIALGVSSVHGC